MKIAAAQLHEALKVAMMGIAQNESVEILTHVFFTGTEVYGYDGTLYVQHELKTDFKGSVRAATLWTIVDALGSGATGDAELEVTDKELSAKIGRARLRVPFNEVDEFEQPKPRTKGSITLVGEDVHRLFEAIEKCLVVADPVGHRDFSRGVVLHGTGIDSASVFGTDTSKLVRCVVELKDSGKLDPIILPYHACKAMLQLRTEASDHRLQFIVNEMQLSCELQFGGKDTPRRTIAKVMSPIPKPEEALPDFEGTINKHLPKRTGMDLDGVTTDLEAVLQRAKRLMAAELARWIKFKGAGTTTSISTKTQRGELLREVVKLPLPENFETHVDVDGMLLGLVHGHKLSLSASTGALFSGKSYTFIFPVTEKPE